MENEDGCRSDYLRHDRCYRGSNAYVWSHSCAANGHCTTLKALFTARLHASVGLNAMTKQFAFPGFVPCRGIPSHSQRVHCHPLHETEPPRIRQADVSHGG